MLLLMMKQILLLLYSSIVPVDDHDAEFFRLEKMMFLSKRRDIYPGIYRSTSHGTYRGMSRPAPCGIYRGTYWGINRGIYRGAPHEIYRPGNPRDNPRIQAIGHPNRIIGRCRAKNMTSI